MGRFNCGLIFFKMQKFYSTPIRSTITTLEVIIILCIAFQCNKVTPDESNKLSNQEFMDMLIGKWQVNFYGFETGIPTDYLSISSDYDNINQYYHSDTSGVTYNATDPEFCNLSRIENIQKWSIIQVDDTLKLYVVDFCGMSNNYEIIFDSPRNTIEDNRYDYLIWVGTLANVKLVNQSSEIVLSDFYVENRSIALGYKWINFKFDSVGYEESISLAFFD